MPSHDLSFPESRAVFDAVPGKCLLLSPDLIVAGVTDGYLHATMTRREDIIGRNLFDVFPTSANAPDAGGARHLSASLQRVLERKVPDHMAMQKVHIRRPDSGGGGGEDRYWSSLNTPVVDDAGQVRYIIHWVEDVTDVVRLSQELEKGERRYRFLADAVPQLIWTADPAGRVDYVNSRWTGFTGWTSDQLLGDGWQRALHAEDRERVVGAWTEAVARKAEQFQEEHRLLHHDGTWRFVLTTAVPYRNDSRDILKWLGTTMDIHERVKTDDQMRQAQRLHAVGKLAGGMAHEVNNMMSAVLGFGELALGGMMPDDPHRRDVEEMVKAGRRASDVTRQLLAFSRQQVLKPVVMDLNDVVSELAPALERLLGADRRLEVLPSRRAVRVRADRGQMDQVLINLVSNARDATPANGMVMIKLDTAMVDEALLASQLESELSTGRYARIVVSDNGSGMPPDVVARVFEPFFTTKVVGRGTGLGLSMVYGIVKQSGGFLGVESTPDHGTAFTVHLPVVDAEITEPILSPMAPQGQGETILVVEDEQVVRSLVFRILEAYGYRVYQAPTGIAALEFLSKPGTQVDLVVSDIVMPRMSGRELATRIHEGFPGLPVLFMSGYSGDEIRQRGLMEEGAPFLQKPITPDALAIAVRTELDRMERAHRLR